MRTGRAGFRKSVGVAEPERRNMLRAWNTDDFPALFSPIRQPNRENGMST
ncbi:hypothetical protein OHO27_00055 [Streptomyces sp. NBC_00443]